MKKLKLRDEQGLAQGHTAKASEEVYPLFRFQALASTGFMYQDIHSGDLERCCTRGTRGMIK